MLLGHAVCDSQMGKIPIYQGMKVMITQNRNKRLCVVSGRMPQVVRMHRATVYPVTFRNEDGSPKTVMPFMPAYALTIPKAQGQTLDQCIVWLDCPVIAPGGAYVALSRCKKLSDIHFMVPIMSSQVTPVSL